MDHRWRAATTARTTPLASSATITTVPSAGVRARCRLGSQFGPSCNTDPDVLTTWVVEVALPIHPGFGLQRPPPPAENLRSPAERRAAVAARQESRHAESPATTGDCGIAPRSAESRHVESRHVPERLDASDEDDVSEDPWATRRRALRGHLLRALNFRERIDQGLVANAAAVAAEEGLTRARVCQLLKLLDLAPEVLDDLEDKDGVGPVPSEHKLRKLAGVRPVEDQVERYRELVEAEAVSQHQGGKPKPPLPRRGFQHLFRRARRYHAMLESGEAPSLEALAREEGISSTRVRQVLMLLQLPPEVVESMDVPAIQLPPGLREKDLRRLVSAGG
jgi:hypothetical protein